MIDLKVKQGKERIVCLTEECTEALYLMGEQDRIVGVSSHTVRPPDARKKPKVSTFMKAKTEEILDLKPDLIIGFSDIQADIAQQLIKEGLDVYIANHRSVSEILTYIHILGGFIGETQKSLELVEKLQTVISENTASEKEIRLKTYFEEWHDPIITGIQWVSECIEIAGGQDVFPHLRHESLAKNRIISTEKIVEADPEVIFVSWCGKKYNPNIVKDRESWKTISAVIKKRVFEIPSSLILQPGPACILEGLPLIKSHLDMCR